MHRLFVSTPPGLEAVAAAEAAALGLGEVRAMQGGVECLGDLTQLLRANASLRTASRVLLRLGEGSTRTLPEVAASIDWAAWLSPGATFAVEIAGGGRHPAPMVRAIQAAITRSVAGARAADPGEQTLHLRVSEGSFVLSLDSSGEHLHRRAYRQETGAAPLRENLAAGILLLAGYDGSQPLLDPMCGSGTFLIEGALLARELPPGAHRRFACEGWPSLPAARIDEVREELHRQGHAAPSAPIVGSDRNAGALGVARRNATRAGVLDSIELARLDVGEASPPPGAGPGIVVANPPYGKRSGERGELLALYRRLGETLQRRFEGWRAAVLIADRRLAPALALPDPRELPLRNGGLPCTLLLAQL